MCPLFRLSSMAVCSFACAGRVCTHLLNWHSPFSLAQLVRCRKATLARADAARAGRRATLSLRCGLATKKARGGSATLRGRTTNALNASCLLFYAGVGAVARRSLVLLQHARCTGRRRVRCRLTRTVVCLSSRICLAGKNLPAPFYPSKRATRCRLCRRHHLALPWHLPSSGRTAGGGQLGGGRKKENASAAQNACWRALWQQRLPRPLFYRRRATSGAPACRFGRCVCTSATTRMRIYLQHLLLRLALWEDERNMETVRVCAPAPLRFGGRTGDALFRRLAFCANGWFCATNIGGGSATGGGETTSRHLRTFACAASAYQHRARIRGFYRHYDRRRGGRVSCGGSTW